MTTKMTPTAARLFRPAVLTAVGLAALLLAGCKTAPAGPKVVAEREEVTRAFAPAWYDDTPRVEDGSIYKTAQAYGADPMMAGSIAINLARLGQLALKEDLQ